MGKLFVQMIEFLSTWGVVENGTQRNIFPSFSSISLNHSGCGLCFVFCKKTLLFKSEFMETFFLNSYQ